MASIRLDLITNHVEFTEIPSSGDESECLLPKNPTEQVAKDFRGLPFTPIQERKEISCGLRLSTPSLSEAARVQIPEGCVSGSTPPAPPLHRAPADMKFTVSQGFLSCAAPYNWKPLTVGSERV